MGLAGGSFSTYAYVSGNPISFVDPLGLAEYLGLGYIINHLDWLARLQGDNFWKSPDFKPERQMIERLRRGEETPWDIRFYHHEANEAQMCVKFRGLPPDDALRKIKEEVHDFLDRAQGGDVRDRYHPEVIFKNPGQFR